MKECRSWCQEASRSRDDEKEDTSASKLVEGRFALVSTIEPLEAGIERIPRVAGVDLTKSIDCLGTHHSHSTYA